MYKRQQFAITSPVSKVLGFSGRGRRGTDPAVDPSREKTSARADSRPNPFGELRDEDMEEDNMDGFY